MTREIQKKKIRPPLSPMSKDDWSARILGLAVALYACLLIIRGYTMGLKVEGFRSPLELAGQILAGAKYDLLFVIGLTVTFWLLQALATVCGKKPKIIFTCYRWTVLFSLMISLVNIQVVDHIGTPLNYQWLYYADFGMASDLWDAIFFIVSWKSILLIPLSMIALIIVSNLMTLALYRLETRQKPNGSKSIILVTLFCAGLILARPYSSLYESQQGHVANPVIHFLGSLTSKDDAPLVTMATSVSSDDFQIFSERNALKNLHSRQINPKIRNVLIYVMESVPAEYIETYGGAFPVTPILRSYTSRAIQFENIYAHAPNSHKSLISILTSTYPLLSHKTATKEMADAGFSSMSKRLKKLGYRTGLFYAADLRDAQADKFLSNHAFDVIQDYRSRVCEVKFDAAQNDSLVDFTPDDICTAESASNWIKTGVDKPFFAIIWTDMTHFPYHFSGPEELFVENNSNLNRYLNALRLGDQALGLLLGSLAKEDLAESTLVVVLSDHGEAFGRHNQVGHSGNLYEENVHVPLILINPLIGTGEKEEVIGGLIDVAPTIFEILGLEASQVWQGTSLFDSHKPPRTYFFSTWTQLQFGYRHKDHKFVFNATTNKCTSYDLVSDPMENFHFPELNKNDCLKVQERLAAWIQYQHGMTARIINSPE